MKQYLIFGIFLKLLQKDRLTARELSEKFEVSTRTIYRYVDSLCMAGLPVITLLGKNGGIELDKTFRLDFACLNQKEKNIIRASLEESAKKGHRKEIEQIIKSL